MRDLFLVPNLKLEVLNIKNEGEVFALNSLCPCESPKNAKKFKDCHHLGGSSLSVKERGNIYTRVNLNKNPCYLCDLDTASNHSIAKKDLKVYEKIYSFEITPYERVWKPNFGASHTFRLNPNLYPSNSTLFDLYCASHDDDFFTCVEKKNEFVNEQKQLHALMHRAVAHTFFSKRNDKQMIQRVFNFDSHMDQITHFAHLVQHYKGCECVIKAIELDYFHTSFKTKDFSRVKSLVFEVDCIVEFMGCGAVFSPWSLRGKRIQEVDSLNFFTFTIFSQNSKSYICISWLEGQEKYMQNFFEDFWEKTPTLEQIMQFAFKHIKNYAINHEWWDGLDFQDKSKITKWYNDFDIQKEALTKQTIFCFSKAYLKKIKDDR